MALEDIYIYDQIIHNKCVMPDLCKIKYQGYPEARVGIKIILCNWARYRAKQVQKIASQGGVV